MQRILILGTGLIGASIGLALKQAGFTGVISAWDANPEELATALRLRAIDHALPSRDAVLATQSDPATAADTILLCTPVLPILDWMQKLAPILSPRTLVTDVGSTKLEIAQLAATLFNSENLAHFLPGHPMAGKESGGAALADASLFQGATWLFTPLHDAHRDIEEVWRTWVIRIGATPLSLDPTRHDEVCAWVSHLPQMLSTALAALLEDTFATDPEGLAAVKAIGGRALRETTRLGASPYSMWRDIALTNTEPLALTLSALEQRLAHLRENLRTPELREEFITANRFRKIRD